MDLRFDIGSKNSIKVTTTAQPSTTGDPWTRFAHGALLEWGMARRFVLPEQVQLETRAVRVPVDDVVRELFFFGDASCWVVGGSVDDRAVTVLGSSLDVADLRLATIADLGEFVFLDEPRSR